MVILCDIDGVLANCSHRLHYLENKDYDNFYSDHEILQDEPIIEGLELVKILKNSPSVKLFYLTGRPTKTHDSTKAWLKVYRVDSLMAMRENDDHRKSEVIKAEWVKVFLENHKDLKEPILFIDDDPLNVEGVCNENPQVKGLVFGTERLDRIKGAKC